LISNKLGIINLNIHKGLIPSGSLAKSDIYVYKSLVTNDL